MVFQALTIDVLGNCFFSASRLKRGTPPDLGHPYTQAGAREAAVVREDTPVRTTDAFLREHFA